MANKIISKIGMIFLAAILLIPFLSLASAGNCIGLHVTGDSTSKADIVIVGHGWTESELTDFYNNVNYISDYLLTMHPYSDYSDMINIWYVNQSADLGCTTPGPVCNATLVTALASQCSYDKVYVLVNSTVPGGAGNPSMAFGTASQFKGQTFAHELGGHSFGELMDEYVYSSPANGNLYFSGANCALPEEANYQSESISCDKWSNVPGTGCYSGCAYSNLYRSTLTSIMRDLYAEYFNGPSQKQIEKMIDKFVNLTIDHDPKTTVTLAENETQIFNITKANEADDLTIKWYVNNNEKTASENQISFTYTCRDTNPAIKVNVSYLGISETYEWNVESNVTNVAPEIVDYTPAENVMDENSSLEFSISAEDYNEDALTYSWLLDGAEKSTNQTWTYNTDFNSAGNHNITVIVSDGEFSDSHEWNITVNNVNRKPVITNFNDITAYEGDTITLNPGISDADGESMTVTYSGWMDSNSKQTNYSDSGAHSVTVTAFDGIDNSTKEITINVLNTYEFRTAIKDRNTKERLTGTASIAGTEKPVTADSATIFDYVHPDIEYNIVYSSDGYQTDNYPIYFDSRLADCIQEADCFLMGTIISDCKWDSENSGWLCRLTKEGWQYASYFDYAPSQNAIKRFDYMIK
jgi:hypothetical protein